MATVQNVAPSAARTTTGNSGYFQTPQGTGLSVMVSVTAVSGTTPSMLLTVEWTNDGVNFAQGDPADTFTAITAVVNKVARFVQKGVGYRVVWTITGTTPSLTFGITADTDGGGFTY
jgi:hypothetical protein